MSGGHHGLAWGDLHPLCEQQNVAECQERAGAVLVLRQQVGRNRGGVTRAVPGLTRGVPGVTRGVPGVTRVYQD